jgi:RNA polymerase sigma factor (sigma-70 family)
MSTQDADDETLMLAYRDGDASAFDVLYVRHRQRLFHFLVRKTGSRDIGEELYQEAWLRLIRHHRDYQPTARFSTWLFTLAHSCLMDHFRKQGRIGAVEQWGDDLPDVPACALYEPTAQLESARAAQQFRACLQDLPMEQREVFLLREEGDFSLPDIAAITGQGLEAVKSRLRYALKKLRACLGLDEAGAPGAAGGDA